MLGVELASDVLLAVEVAREELLEEMVVELPALLFVRAFPCVPADKPEPDEGLNVLTVPDEPEDVRPEVLCAAEPEELLEPWM